VEVYKSKLEDTEDFKLKELFLPCTTTITLTTTDLAQSTLSIRPLKLNFIYGDSFIKRINNFIISSARNMFARRILRAALECVSRDKRRNKKRKIMGLSSLEIRQAIYRQSEPPTEANRGSC
jgi:hypothetical protein